MLLLHTESRHTLSPTLHACRHSTSITDIAWCADVFANPCVNATMTSLAWCAQADATALDFGALDRAHGPFTIAVSFLTSGLLSVRPSAGRGVTSGSRCPQYAVIRKQRQKVVAVNAHDMQYGERPALVTDAMTLPCRCGGRRGHNVLPAKGGRAGRTGGVSALFIGYCWAAAGSRGHGAPCVGVQSGVK